MGDDRTSDVAERDLVRHVTWQNSRVPVIERTRLLRQKPATVWLTGLSGAGKSTIAFELERSLLIRGHLAFVMDGDNVRHGLNRDLGFDPEDRKENIRRVAEVAKLFNDAGLIVITSFISPYKHDRAMAREIIGREQFIEIYLNTHIRVCEERDPKGLYKRARQGTIAEFTGITAPYESPDAPNLTLDTERMMLDECVSQINQKLERHLDQTR